MRAIAKCPACGGTGQVDGERCKACHGNMLVSDATPPDAQRTMSLFEAVKVMPLQPDDVILLRVPYPISEDTRQRLIAYVSERVGARHIVLLDGGIDMDIIRKEP